MKRHNAKAIAAAVAIAAADTTAESKKKSNPKPAMNAAVLYVDVVKNMPKPETPPPATPPLPKFIILHEDFPALPGTLDEANVINSTVPDDWSAMISDDEDDDDDDDDEDDDDENVDDGDDEDDDDDADDGDENVDDGDDEDEDDDDGDNDNNVDDDNKENEQVSRSRLPSSLSSSSESVSERAVSLYDTTEPESIPDLPINIPSSSSSSCRKKSSTSEYEIPAVADVAANSTTETINASEQLNSPKHENLPPNFYDYVNESIFDKHFIMAGVQQRAWARQSAKHDTKSHIGPPPGFQHLNYYGRLRTNRLGVPLGGVTFDRTSPPPATATAAHAHGQQSGLILKDAYGMVGLADSLQAAQQHPRLMPQVFGHDVACLNVHTHCSAYEANKLHASFAGALLGGRCAPHELQQKVPWYYRRATAKPLPQPKVEQMQAELLFYFFYTYPNDMLQMLAAAELVEHGWRYHLLERLWIRRQPDNPQYIVTRYQESGEYNYFNMMHWKVMSRHFELLPEQLEKTITKAELCEQYGFHPQMSFF